MENGQRTIRQVLSKLMRESFSRCYSRRNDNNAKANPFLSVAGHPKSVESNEIREKESSSTLIKPASKWGEDNVISGQAVGRKLHQIDIDRIISTNVDARQWSTPSSESKRSMNRMISCRKFDSWRFSGDSGSNTCIDLIVNNFSASNRPQINTKDRGKRVARVDNPRMSETIEPQMIAVDGAVLSLFTNKVNQSSDCKEEEGKCELSGAKHCAESGRISTEVRADRISQFVLIKTPSTRPMSLEALCQSEWTTWMERFSFEGIKWKWKLISWN